MGKTNEEILAYKHNELEVFGSGQDETPEMWTAVIRQALIAKYLSRDIENYGLLKVTAAGNKFMKAPKQFQIVVSRSEEDEDDDDVSDVKGDISSAAADEELYNMLKDLRKKTAKQHDLPPYVIFQDLSLEAMATSYPISIEELQNIPGVGQGKAKRYGEEFVKLIKKYCEEKEIVRPEDLRVRTVANKSKMKVSIIQSIDRKIALDELAVANRMEFSELLDEIEAIVYSGTRININYFLEEVMDEDSIDDIFQYFKEAESDNLEEAYKELGRDYKEEEIRLVRIKFLSEMAN
jgi:ATP-dependent DNA helicase RecQ